jgi:serine/threonine protein kinase
MQHHAIPCKGPKGYTLTIPGRQEPMATLPGTRLGPYEILFTINTGRMGEVYEARDTKVRRNVAIKVLPALFVNDAERSARF